MRPILALALVPTFALTGCVEYGLSAVQREPSAYVEPDEEQEEEEEEERPEEEEGEEPTPDWDPVDKEEPPEDDDPPPPDDCEDTSDLVYVIDRDSEMLSLFDPASLAFTDLGVLDCGTWAGSPASMSVSRDGTAYVRYADDTVYAVNLETLQCSETIYDASFGHFGMGYATDDANTWRDDLYIANGGTLAVLDTNTWNMTTLGSLPSQSELTGNAEGELWAILPLENPARLVQLDKSTAQVMNTHMLGGFPDPFGIDTFAFATWGGDFYLFVRSYGLGNSTDVYRVNGNGSLTRVVTDSGRNLVGAGVSTCAPAE